MERGIYAEYCDGALVSTLDDQGSTHERLGLLLGGRVNNTEDKVVVGFIMDTEDALAVVTVILLTAMRLDDRFPDRLIARVRQRGGVPDAAPGR